MSRIINSRHGCGCLGYSGHYDKRQFGKGIKYCPYRSPAHTGDLKDQGIDYKKSYRIVEITECRRASETDYGSRSLNSEQLQGYPVIRSLTVKTCETVNTCNKSRYNAGDRSSRYAQLEDKDQKRVIIVISLRFPAS